MSTTGREQFLFSLSTYNGVDNSWRLDVATLGKDDVECVDDPRRPGDGEGDDDEQEGDGDVPLVNADALPFLGRVKTHADAVAADHGERHPVADADDQHRHCVACDHDDEEVRERRHVGGISRPALSRSRLVDDVGQRTDGRSASSGRPQPRT